MQLNPFKAYKDRAKKDIDSYAANAAQSIFNAAATLRRGLGQAFGISPDGNRDYNALYGYGTDLSYANYRALYDRGGIAHTLVEKIPKACWRDMPEIKSGESTVLEDDLLALKKVGLFNALERADIVGRIGRYSILLIEVADNSPLDEPLGSARNIDDLGFRVYSEAAIEIVEFDKDPTSKRFGYPVKYQVSTVNVESNSLGGEAITRIVHWSRVVHLAEGALESPLVGQPILKPAWNTLIDVLKIRGGAGEAYFRNARQKFALEANKDTKVSTDPTAIQALKDNVEAFQDGLEDVIRLQGMTANVLQPGMVSPRDAFDICVEELAGIYNIPIRSLIGKGGGQLAGSEDKAALNAVVRDRQEQDCTQWLNRALDILNEAGLIKLPATYEIEWPTQSALSEKEESEAIEKRASAFKAMADGFVAIDQEPDVKDLLEAVGLDEIKTFDIEIDETELGAIDEDNI